MMKIVFTRTLLLATIIAGIVMGMNTATTQYALAQQNTQPGRVGVHDNGSKHLQKALMLAAQ